MFKLVVVAGKLRGEEFELNEGENTLGRDSMCDFCIEVDGVSKRHFSIDVKNRNAFLKDLGSSNGTFLNGKIIKSATIKNGDKIALPDTIIQVVEVVEKKVMVEVRVSSSTEEEDDDEVNSFTGEGETPENIAGKAIHFFKYKVMNLFHGINEEYEWRVLFGILLSIFVFSTIALTIVPVLNESHKVLLSETAKRGVHFAEEIARINARALEQKDLDRVDTNFLNKEVGVASYELFDLEGRIVRPIGKQNEYISDSFSVQAKNWGRKTGDKLTRPLRKVLSDGEIGIAQKIIAYNARVGIPEAVGIIAIHFKPKTLATINNRDTVAFLESLITSSIVAIIFFGIIYYLTIRPIDEVRFQLDEVLRGKRKALESNYLMAEMVGLRSNINSLIQRWKEAEGDGEYGDMDEMEDDGSYVNILKEIMTGAVGAILILDSQKVVQDMNEGAEEATGLNGSTAIGATWDSVAPNPGLQAAIDDLCDSCANSDGVSQNTEFELRGLPYQFFVSSLIGKDGFAKAFYIAMNKDE